MPSHLRTVAIVGIDGSGKSTQVRLLARTLEDAGARVVSVHPFGWKLLSLATSATTGPPARAEAFGPRTGAMRQMVALAELADIGAYLWIAQLRFRMLSLVSARPAWLLSDRSAVDVLIKQRRRGLLGDAFLSWWQRILPQPQVTVWLRTDPEVARDRDREFPPSYYEDLHELYGEASEQFGWCVLDSSGRTSAAVHDELMRVLGDQRNALMM